ncbi:hypothetical protein D3C75_936240 [compost metagenome]
MALFEEELAVRHPFPLFQPACYPLVAPQLQIIPKPVHRQMSKGVEPMGDADQTGRKLNQVVLHPPMLQLMQHNKS